MNQELDSVNANLNGVAEEVKKRKQIRHENVILLFRIESFSFGSINHWLGHRS